MWSELAFFWYILKYGTSDRWGSWGGGGGEETPSEPQSGGGRGRGRSWDSSDGLGAARHSASLGRDWAGEGGGVTPRVFAAGCFVWCLDEK